MHAIALDQQWPDPHGVVQEAGHFEVDYEVCDGEICGEICGESTEEYGKKGGEKSDPYAGGSFCEGNFSDFDEVATPLVKMVFASGTQQLVTLLHSGRSVAHWSCHGRLWGGALSVRDGGVGVQRPQ